MKNPWQIVFACLLVVSPALAAGAGGDPFRVLPTPTGCAVLIDRSTTEYRVDALVDGGVIVGLDREDLPYLEKEMPGTCLARVRIYASARGTGTSLEMRPNGVEFGGVIHSKDKLQILFERVVMLGPASRESSAASRAYQLGAGDVIKITVFNHDDLSKEVTVDSEGKINYALLGNIPVGGKSPREVQDELGAILGKSYIVNPQVAVEVKTYASQFVYVNGPVKTPGRLPLQGGLTLKDAISLAGGFTSETGSSVTVARLHDDPSGGGKSPEKTRFSRQDVEYGLANFELESGDVVTVSEKDYVYINGEVREPGKYELGSGLTLLKAIAVSKGLTDWADRKHIRLIRVVGGQTIPETISVRDIERQKIPDVPLFAGDMIVVPRRIL